MLTISLLLLFHPRAPEATHIKFLAWVIGCRGRAIRGCDAGYNQRQSLDVMKPGITKATANRSP